MLDTTVGTSVSILVGVTDTFVGTIGRVVDRDRLGTSDATGIVAAYTPVRSSVSADAKVCGRAFM